LFKDAYRYTHTHTLTHSHSPMLVVLVVGVDPSGVLPHTLVSPGGGSPACPPRLLRPPTHPENCVCVCVCLSVCVLPSPAPSKQTGLTEGTVESVFRRKKSGVCVCTVMENIDI